MEETSSKLYEVGTVTDCSIELKNKRSVQAALMSEDSNADRYYLIRGHCTDGEFEAGKYRPDGVIATARTKTQDWDEAKGLMERIAEILETV